MLDSGTIVDAALAIVALEAIALVVLRRRLGRGTSVAALLANLAAGFGLMLAVRAAIVGAAWPWLAACLAAAGVAHGVDLAMRWRAGDRPPSTGTVAPP